VHKDKKIVIDDLASGKVIFVIGTQTVPDDRIKFKDLGLRYIERSKQSLLVSSKANIKALRSAMRVDILTLTAIRLSLQNLRIMALRAWRWLSIF